MPDFAQHLLRDNRGSQRPARWLFYDCETREEKHTDYSLLRMYLGWSYFVRADLSPDFSEGEWRKHTSQESINRYIESLTAEKTVLHLVGHNVFFDLQASGFFRYFTRAGWKLEFYYDKGLTYVLIIRKGNRRIKAVSTTNYFAESLERLGNHLGLPKQEVSFLEATEEEIESYCHRDVEIIVAGIAAWIRFIDAHDCGSFGLTRASQSFRAFRHRFLKHPISVHSDPTVQDLERACYLGGRTEAFRIGEIDDGPVSCYDVNSMYPFVMREHVFPYRLIDYKESPPIENIRENVKIHAVCAEVELETNEPAYGIRYQGKIVFPIGRFRAYLTTPGLRYALKHRHLKRVVRASYYESASLFSEYVDYFYSIKQAAKDSGDTVTLSMVKIFLNSLYGKFGQRHDEMIQEPCYDGPEYLRLETYEESTGKTITETYLMNTRITVNGDRPGDDSFVAIAAHVTEYARFYLWEIMKRIGPDRVLYCDTDSVWIRSRDDSFVRDPIHPSNLGALSLDGTYDHMIIHGAKDYVLDGHRKLKGVPARADTPTPGVYRYDQFAGQSTHLRLGIDDAFLLRPIEKRPRRLYDKGIVDPGGKVHPLVMGEIS